MIQEVEVWRTVKPLWRHFSSRFILQPVDDREKGNRLRNFDRLKSDLLMFDSNWRLKVVTVLIRSWVIFCLYHLESKQEFSFSITELAVCICIQEWKILIRPDKLSSNEHAWTGVNKSIFSHCDLLEAHGNNIVIQSADFPIGLVMQCHERPSENMEVDVFGLRGGNSSQI